MGTENEVNLGLLLYRLLNQTLKFGSKSQKFFAKSTKNDFPF